MILYGLGVKGTQSVSNFQKHNQVKPTECSDNAKKEETLES